MTARTPPPPLRDLDELRDRLRAFAAARDWDQFHSPKNLAMALIAEAAELVEHFQWLTEEQSARAAARQQGEGRGRARRRAGLPRAHRRPARHRSARGDAGAKMDRNETKYPARRVKGSARKYTEY